MSSIEILRGGKTFVCQSENGENLLEMLRRANAAPAAPCGGNGKCGKCLVTVENSTGRKTVRACTEMVSGDCRVTVPEETGGVICQDRRIGTASGGGKGFGIAADIGTTTVAASLLDLGEGRVLGVKSGWNRQTAFGGDVISRMQYIMDNRDGLSRLTGLIREQLGELTASLCEENGVEENDITAVFAAGNTVMEHIFAGLDPSSIASAPFVPETLFSAIEPMPLLHTTYCAPCVAGYVGGDITAGLLASGVWEKPGKSLFLDVGTNGEMALGGRDGLLCCAVACGPAFEGAEISCGMESTAGAVCHASWDGQLHMETVGGGTPKGVCGSGLLDILAVLLRLGIVDETGRLLPPDEVPEEFACMVEEDENGNGSFLLTADGSVRLLASDVRKLQLAKAAVAAGIQVMLEQADMEPEAVDRLYLAGGFGSRLDPHSAAAIGMIPACLAERAEAVGNTSLAGAELALFDPKRRADLDRLRDGCRYLELSGHRGFNNAYIDNMMFDTED